VLRHSSTTIPAPRERHDAGFMLAEALVALGILALVIALSQATFASGWRAQNHAAGEDGAVAIARMHLAATGVESPLRAGMSSGSDGKYDWRIDVARYDPPGQGAGKPRLAAWWVSVAVTSTQPASPLPRSVTLKTLKIGGRTP